MSGKLPVHGFLQPFLYIRIYTETVRYGEQMLTLSEVHLNDHPKAYGHELIRNSMQREEVDQLLAIIITMGIMEFPTIRWILAVYYCLHIIHINMCLYIITSKVE